MQFCRPASRAARRALTAALLCAAAGFCAHMQAEKPGKPVKEHHRSDSHQIEELEQQWVDAMLKNDATVIDHMTTEDFLSITSNGTLSDKQQYLRRISNHVNEFTTIELKVLKVRVQPGSAIATSQTHVIGKLDGHPVDGIFRYTKVYTRSPGSPWRVVNFEVTRVSRAAGEPGMERGMPLEASPSQPAAAPH